MKDFDYWRLNDDLSIIEAALLVIGEDPGQLAPYVEKHEAQNQPRGYMAVSGQPWHLDHASLNMLRCGESLSLETASDAAATRRCGCSCGWAAV
jgi:hypothetical protein